jgi:hypothetical protein
LPIPGRLKIVSMMKDPVTRKARMGPRMVTTGISALRIMWTTTMVRSLRPLLWAVRT